MYRIVEQLKKKLYDRNYELGKEFDDRIKTLEYLGGSNFKILLTGESTLIENSKALVSLFLGEIYELNISAENLTIEVFKRDGLSL